jgi:DnaJ-class molecular chaperone
MSFNPYEILGVNSTCSIDDIKKNYKQKALELHPDRGGDEEKFKQLQESYEILSNDQSRQEYDLSQTQTQPNLFTNLFNIFASTMLKTESIIYNIEITLDDIYTQATKNIKINVMINDIPYIEHFNLNIQSTVYNGQRVVISNKGNKKHNLARGDIIIYTTIKKHILFEKIDDTNLRCILPITLKDALTPNTPYNISFLNNETLTIILDTIITPNYVHIIQGKGLTKNSNLICIFNVIFPTHLTKEKLEEITKLL